VDPSEPSLVMRCVRCAGVFATKRWSAFDIVGEYVGRVVPPKIGGDYVAVFERDDPG
jgi:hypothetical protein